MLEAVAITAAAVAIALVAVARRLERLVNRRVGPRPAPASSEAAALHRSAFVVDLHADSLLWGRDLARRSRVGHVDLPRLRAGGVGLQVFTIVTRVPIGVNIRRTDPRWPDLVTLLALSRRWPRSTVASLADRAFHQAERLTDLARRDGRLRLVRSAADLDALAAERSRDPAVVGALLGVEGAHALEGRIDLLAPLFEAGVRLVGLVHFFDNEFAGSAHGLAKHGLTPLGRELVAEMNRRGMVVDLAHASAATIREVVALSTRPPLVSHTGVRGTRDNERNLSDDQLRDVARAGGVVGIGYWKTAVGGAGVVDVARAIGHAVAVAGDEHVGLGSDFDGAVAAPFDAAELPALTEALLSRGIPPESIRRILGENALRVLRDALRPAPAA